MDAWIYILLAFLPVLYIIRCLYGRQRYVYPPGPKGWPLFGNVFDVDVPTMHLTFTEMSKKYGDIVRVNFLGMNIVVLNSTTAIRQALTSDELAEVYAGRPKTFIGTYTIISRATTYMDPSEEWFKRRKVLHKTLKMYGEGVREQEVVMRTELGHVIERLGGNEGPCIMEDIFLPSLINIMTIMVIGKRFDYDDERLINSVAMYKWGNKMATIGFDVTMMLLPFLRHFSFGYGRYYQTFQRHFNIFCQYCVEEPKSTFNPAVSRGLIDVLLKAQKEEQKTDGRPWLEDEDIKAMVFDTMGAGILTSRGALLSFFLVILHKPEVAKRVQEEIDRVVGSSRYPELKDRSEMPYTEACILETLRFISHVSLSLPHCTTKDSRLGDYFLPANTMVFPNLWAVHHDETLWTDPWAFVPERFLDEHGKMLPPEHANRRNLMAFSVGRRSCLGEGFAKARLFLYITSLLQRFHFKSPDGVESLPPLDPRHFVPGLVLSPAQYSAVAVPR